MVDETKLRFDLKKKTKKKKKEKEERRSAMEKEGNKIGESHIILPRSLASRSISVNLIGLATITWIMAKL